MAGPAGVAGCIGWWKADALALTDGAAVSSWTESSGSGPALVQATGGSQPVYKASILNSLPVVRFNGSSNFMAAGSTIANIAMVFAVAKYNGAAFSDYDGLFTGTVSDSSNSVLLGLSGDTAWFTGDWTGQVYYINGTLDATDQAPMNAFKHFNLSGSNFNAALTPQVGRDRGTAGRYWNGDIAEIICYSSVLGTTDRQAVESYLATKWFVAGGPTANQSETVIVTETPIVQIYAPSVAVTDLEYHLSANATSLGGAIAGTITSGAANNVWDDVTSGESASGDAEYRCIYIKNAHPSTTWQAPKVWIDTQATPDTVAIALDSAAVGSTAASTSANESTAPTGGGAPYTFTSPTDKASGLQIADIPPGQYKAIWLRRTVPSSAAANPADAMSVRCEGSTP